VLDEKEKKYIKALHLNIQNNNHQAAYFDDWFNLFNNEFKLDSTNNNIKNKNTNWKIRIDEKFLKNIDKVDGKKKSKLWDIIKKITKDPMNKIGDTIKPLTGDLKNYWRGRMGDYRIIYFPDENLQIIDLIMLKHRKDIYN